MSTTMWIVIAAIAVVVIAIIVALALKARQKKRDERLAVHARELRSEATAHDSELEDARLRASKADAEAALVRAEAERAERQATETRLAAQQHEAKREDILREADRIDPHLDGQDRLDRSDTDSGRAEPGHVAGQNDPGQTERSPGQHRAD